MKAKDCGNIVKQMINAVKAKFFHLLKSKNWRRRNKFNEYTENKTNLKECERKRGREVNMRVCTYLAEFCFVSGVKSKPAKFLIHDQVKFARTHQRCPTNSWELPQSTREVAQNQWQVTFVTNVV